MSFDFIGAIKNIAPIIAGTFGTPLAGLAVKAICSVLPDGQAKEVADAHAGDPIGGAAQKLGEMLAQGIITTAQLKQAELSHAERMAELGYKSVADLEKISADDRDSARKREIAVKDETPKILAAIVVTSWVFIQWHLINNSVPDDMREIIMRVLGTLDAALMMVLAYYFGSSASSKEKDKTLADIAKS